LDVIKTGFLSTEVGKKKLKRVVPMGCKKRSSEDMLRKETNSIAVSCGKDAKRGENLETPFIQPERTKAFRIWRLLSEIRASYDKVKALWKN